MKRKFTSQNGTQITLILQNNGVGLRWDHTEGLPPPKGMITITSKKQLRMLLGTSLHELHEDALERILEMIKPLFLPEDANPTFFLLNNSASDLKPILEAAEEIWNALIQTNYINWLD